MTTTAPLVRRVPRRSKRQIEHGVEQRVSGTYKRGERGALHAHELALEGDAFVGLHDGSADPDVAVTIADSDRDVADLEAASLARRQAPTEPAEGLFEERLDEVRLELAGLHALHLQADLLDVSEGHHVLMQRLRLEHVPEPLPDRGIDYLKEPGLDLGLIAVADGLNEQVLQTGVAEHLSEHVVDPAVERLALVFELFQQSPVDVAFTSLGRHEVPHVADLGLANTVHAAEALLDAVRVPRQVVVDEQMGSLKVDALSRRVGRHKESAIGLLREPLLRLLPVLPAGAAVDRDDSFVTTEHRA